MADGRITYLLDLARCSKGKFTIKRGEKIGACCASTAVIIYHYHGCGRGKSLCQRWRKKKRERDRRGT